MRRPKTRDPRSIVGAALAALVALGHPPLVWAGESAAGPAPGAWVRVRTGADVKGNGFDLTSRSDAEFAHRARGSLMAEDGDSVTFEIEGQPVRVLRPNREAEGTLRLVDAATLVLDRGVGARPIVVPRDAVSSLDVRLRESRKGRGVLIGLLAGAALGALLGIATSGDDGLGLDAESMGAAAGAVIGAPAGGLVGFLVAPGARWEPHRGVRVSVSAAF